MEGNNLELLQRVLGEDFDLDPGSITTDSLLYEDLDLDSIDAVDLIVRLKELTGKKVPPEQFKSVRTVGDVVAVLDSL